MLELLIFVDDRSIVMPAVLITIGLGYTLRDKDILKGGGGKRLYRLLSLAIYTKIQGRRKGTLYLNGL